MKRVGARWYETFPRRILKTILRVLPRALHRKEWEGAKELYDLTLSGFRCKLKEHSLQAKSMRTFSKVKEKHLVVENQSGHCPITIFITLATDNSGLPMWHSSIVINVEEEVPELTVVGWKEGENEKLTNENARLKHDLEAEHSKSKHLQDKLEEHKLEVAILKADVTNIQAKAIKAFKHLDKFEIL
ncbi:hypothetical protein Adt_20954 [Abeliophyllum distichum]|uniref:Uncharacterized protein n=1 Tax=Abeliophyllum distichum TaxID=126358 RepID=A0ABD1SY38_9LAMI